MKTIYKTYNTYKLYSDEHDIVYIVDNLTKFCRDMGLPFHPIYQMVIGRSEKSNGLTCI